MIEERDKPGERPRCQGSDGFAAGLPHDEQDTASGGLAPAAATVWPDPGALRVFKAIFDHHDPDRVATAARLVNEQSGMTLADLLALAAMNVATVLSHTEKPNRVQVLSGVLACAVELAESRDRHGASTPGWSDGPA